MVQQQWVFLQQPQLLDWAQSCPMRHILSKGHHCSRSPETQAPPTTGRAPSPPESARSQLPPARQPRSATSGRPKRRRGVGGGGWARAWAAGTQCGTGGTDGRHLACPHVLRSPGPPRKSVRVFIPPGELPRRAMAPHRPASPGAPPAPYAQPHDGALSLITSLADHTVRSPTSRAVAHTGTMSAQSMLTMQPTRRCPQAHRPNAHAPVEGVKLAG